MAKSLLGRGDPLALAAEQRSVLTPKGAFPPFNSAVAQAGLAPLSAIGVQTLQINLGKLCNQTCKHCHVDAGPDRREVMTRATIEACLTVVRAHPIPTVDLTGGAPEMNPDFRFLVREARAAGRHVIDRCNLTILLANGFRDLPGFLAENQVEIIASLPYFAPRMADSQRGTGVFEASITALRTLNALGYGREGSGLVLNLVHNPTGAFFPGRQSSLESEYRRELADRFGVAFNHLFAITNMPISRFLEYLLRTEQYEPYMERLVAAFNPATAQGLMCRTTLSVGWDGFLYDCDFNQMLDLPLAKGAPRTIHDFDPRALAGRPIVTGPHCYGCTAGAGSSCGGEVARP